MVKAPNTNVNWVIGASRNINWMHNLGTAESVRIELSRDGGESWAELAASVQNSGNTSGSFNWVMAGPVTVAARIRVSWVRDNGVQDAGDVNFRIGSRITVTAPNTAVTWSAGSTRTVAWTHTYGIGQTFDVAFSPDAGASWISLASGVHAATATTGTYTGHMPTAPTTQALMRVSPSGVPGDGDVGNTTFMLTPPAITVTAPNTNVNWTIGSTRSINWIHNLGPWEQVQIEVSRDGGTTWTIVSPGAPNSGNTAGTFSWVVPGPATTAGRVRVTWVFDGTVQDSSNVNFRIQ
jgi:hypothetical protein